MKFVLKALAIFLVWYLVYEVWVLPDGRLDEWISLNIVGTAAGILDLFGYDVYTVNRIIGMAGNSGVEVVDRCNGIGALGLFLAFVFAYPGTWGNRLSFSLLGIGVIYLTNLSRIIFLVIVKEKWPDLFDFIHDYTTTAIFYIVIFILWMLWIKTDEQQFASKS